MINELAKLIEEFPGAPNRTRCFNHVIALVAKRVVRQFDVPVRKENEIMDDDEKELQGLAQGQDVEEEQSQREIEIEENECDDDDGDDGALAMEGIASDEFDRSLRPVRTLLVKVSNFSSLLSK